MKRHQDLIALFDCAEREFRCAHPSDRALECALRRRVAAGECLCVFPGLYSRVSYWSDLRPPDRTLHIARALQSCHPKWRFAGLVAATVHGFDHQWSLHNGLITLATSGKSRRGEHLSRIHMSEASGAFERMEGIIVTSPQRTVVDCCRLLPFCNALSIADSALAHGVSKESILDVCGAMRRDCSQVLRVLHYADALSDNGGESFVRGSMLSAGFQRPELQVEFIDPRTRAKYRADYVWRLQDGSTIVGELDGAAKYVEFDMTNGRSVKAVVALEREREEGLKRAGVASIVRFTFDDAVRGQPLADALLRAGVPKRA